MTTICKLPHQTFLHTHRKLVQTMPWALSMHKNIRMFKKLPLFMSSGITSYTFSFCLKMESKPPLIMDNIHNTTSQKNQT
jgi:hypothetical protein